MIVTAKIIDVLKTGKYDSRQIAKLCELPEQNVRVTLGLLHRRGRVNREKQFSMMEGRGNRKMYVYSLAEEQN